MDWCKPDYALQDAYEFVEITQKGFKELTQYDFGIFGSDDRYLGEVGLNHIDPQAKYANLGYWVRTSATGSGVAPAAVREITSWAFENTDLHRLEIVAAVDKP